MSKRIGPTFAQELENAGLQNIPVCWDPENFSVSFSDSVSQEEQDAWLAVLEAHDPTKQLPPAFVTRYQCRAALLDDGILNQVDAWFAALPDDDKRKMAWLQAPTVEYGSDATNDAATALGLTDEQKTQLFIKANTY